MSSQLESSTMPVQPTPFQALRVYFSAPEMILAEVGYVDVFSITFDLIQQTLLPPRKKMRFFPLCGGNYVIWRTLGPLQCVAVFSEETSRKLGENTVEKVLLIIENELSKTGRPFLEIMVENKPSLTIVLENTAEFFLGIEERGERGGPQESKKGAFFNDF